MEKMKRIEMLAYNDPKYLKMLDKIKVLEDKVDELEHELTDEQRNLIWDFWGVSSQMEIRKLELACQYMDFVE